MGPCVTQVAKLNDLLTRRFAKAFKDRGVKVPKVLELKKSGKFLDLMAGAIESRLKDMKNATPSFRVDADASEFASFRASLADGPGEDTPTRPNKRKEAPATTQIA